MSKSSRAAKLRAMYADGRPNEGAKTIHRRFIAGPLPRLLPIAAVLYWFDQCEHPISGRWSSTSGCYRRRSRSARSSLDHITGSWTACTGSPARCSRGDHDSGCAASRSAGT